MRGGERCGEGERFERLWFRKSYTIPFDEILSLNSTPSAFVGQVKIIVASLGSFLSRISFLAGDCES